uniref:Phosphodiesterase n=1 Tax=Xenopus tropicalis TaxID=8364 RepID=A0A1B8XY21_XENTR
MDSRTEQSSDPPSNVPAPKGNQHRTQIPEGTREALKRPTFNVLGMERPQMLSLLEHMFYQLDLVATFKMEPETLRCFLSSVQEHYQENPFHNFHHGFSVAQMLYCCQLQVWSLFSGCLFCLSPVPTALPTAGMRSLLWLSLLSIPSANCRYALSSLAVSSVYPQCQLQCQLQVWALSLWLSLLSIPSANCRYALSSLAVSSVYPQCQLQCQLQVWALSLWLSLLSIPSANYRYALSLSGCLFCLSPVPTAVPTTGLRSLSLWLSLLSIPSANYGYALSSLAVSSVYPQCQLQGNWNLPRSAEPHVSMEPAPKSPDKSDAPGSPPPIVRERLLPSDTLAMMVAALCHDLDHPGLSNSYQVNAQTDLAKRYNYNSPLENHHWAVTLRILSQEKSNLLVNVAPEQLPHIQQEIMELILATDMVHHGKILQSLQHIETLSFSNREHVTALKKTLIKLCDISNEARPADQAEVWADSLMEEYFLQSDREKAEGLPVTPYMDRDRVRKADAQSSFITFLLLPLCEALCQHLPQLSDSLLQPLRAAKLRYQQQMDKEMGQIHVTDMDTRNRHGYAQPTWIRATDMDTRNRHGYAQPTWIRATDMDTRNRHGYAQPTWIRATDMDTRYRHGYALPTYTYVGTGFIETLWGQVLMAVGADTA